ncbi:MAG TPA: BTAD domain-containing putative transcriptional regulator [Ktedonobacteraceae bacterium]|nr:BTAD domain-containing putative transcriptional regulator [Ktedonobacteraceae bacterium]
MDENRQGSSESGIFPLYRAWLCGSFRLERREGLAYVALDTKEWGGHSSPRTVLKALICAPRRRASRGTLLAQIWPEAEGEQASRDLNVAISRLRKILRPVEGQECFTTEEDSLGFSLAHQSVFWVDADAALARLEEAAQVRHHSSAALPLLEEGWQYFQRGGFLENDEGEWAENKRAIVERGRYRCRLWLAEAYVEQGHLGQAETILNELLGDDPTDEVVVGHLMRLLHQRGLTHQAMVLYRHTSTLFTKEGLELSEATRILAAQLPTERHLPFTTPIISGEITRVSSGSMASGQTIMEETCLPERDFMDQLRRQILLGSSVAFLASQDLKFGVELTERLARALTRSSFIEEKTLSYLERRIGNYWQDRNDVSLPASVLVSYVLEDLQKMTALLAGSLLPTMRARLCSIVGMAAMLIGELYYDMRWYSRARDYQNLAILAAHEADDAVLEAVAWGRNSFAWTYDENFEEARNTVQRARHLAQTGNNTVRSWLAAVEAEIQSNLADREACLQALKEAASVEDWNAPQAACYWIHFDPSLLAGYQGISFLKLSHQGHKDLALPAQAALQNALRLLDPSMKRRQPTLFIDLAGTYVQQGEIEQACGYAFQAIDFIKHINSKVVLQRLLMLRDTLAPWNETRSVQDLDGRVELLLTSENQ